MGFKKKVFGFVAAAALTLSMAGGAAAAPSSGTVSGSVELKEGLCGINMSVSNTDLGTFTYQDTQYVRTGGNPEAHLSGTIFPSKHGGKCDVTVTTGGLIGSSGTIPSTHFQFSINGSGWVPMPAVTYPTTGYTFPNADSGSGTIGIKLDSVPSDFQPGIYSGSLTIGVTNAD